jgi:hypothetical protein
MRYYIDTEFDGFRGPLISMALVREDGRSLYFIVGDPEATVQDQWVRENVLPILKDCPEPPWTFDMRGAAAAVGVFLADDAAPCIVADWPDDIRHLCDVLHFAPGRMIDVPGMRFEVKRVDAYPTPLPGAVQHNAWWDACALREKVEADEEAEARAAFGHDPESDKVTA